LAQASVDCGEGPKLGGASWPRGRKNLFILFSDGEGGGGFFGDDGTLPGIFFGGDDEKKKIGPEARKGAFQKKKEGVDEGVFEKRGGRRKKKSEGGLGGEFQILGKRGRKKGGTEVGYSDREKMPVL